MDLINNNNNIEGVGVGDYFKVGLQKTMSCFDSPMNAYKLR